MTDGETFEEATDTVVGFLSDFAGEVEPYDLESSDDKPRQRLVHVEEPVGPDYTVVATEGERFFRLQATYRLWRDVAESLSETDIDEYAPPTVDDSHPVQSVVPGVERFDDSRQRRFAAAVEVLDALPHESRRNLILQLTAVFTRAGLKHSVGAVREGSGITEFSVYHRLFPYEDDFSISRLSDTVECVRMAAHMGELLLKYTFNLPVDISGSGSGDVTDPGGLPARATRTVDAGEAGEPLNETDSE
ncbi:hypothetical protein [Halobaculum sp. MBLA0143]|uniref:hypothetical protein n=1 Tax=Halobaculum sp. MBLA0143 TaxID=3079933 RepID=UPI003525D59F